MTSEEGAHCDQADQNDACQRKVGELWKSSCKLGQARDQGPGKTGGNIGPNT